jgi:tRNA-intron lyase
MNDTQEEIKEVFGRRPRHKKRFGNDIVCDKLKLYELLQSYRLHGVLVDAAVWLVCSSAAVKSLDHICLGNLDGGHGMTAYLRQELKSIGVDVTGMECTVRLSLDEAFFMHFALAALDLYVIDLDTGGKKSKDNVSETINDSRHGAETNMNSRIKRLGTQSAWKLMVSVRPDFPLLYAVYHHFRGKGWIPRTGLQYGADFTLYQKHPALTHSDYSVCIQTPRMSLEFPISRPPATWHDIQITNRLTTQVGKRLLIVNIHDERPELGYDNHRCLDRIELSEYLVRRWVPDRTR